ncbi:MAG: hypothetical protein K0R64_2197 [Novosphingobium lindaniclasticum]|uniref:Uncharacterized protein n=1 Tax=Novosphingobium lindaniclasticum LE124 TaxID=1096930 RepID=T0JB70_9SPHN|nr:hypothetical protein [Novosphingobium lindaniclasticum]EQB19164.1 hypothetical protein L284_02715 [Novosphingobium lindaniclasticum LE124]MDF2639213.1 hypothetical protein [Novosphingobium lindaniclasticum]
MAQKGAGGNSGAVTNKGGDGAQGSTGTGRGGGKSGGGTTGERTRQQDTEAGKRSGVGDQEEWKD